ncbi:MAG: hypothetical protein H7233_08360 [Pseudorhodobacter sp.]|nr:hypothetical protein [Frankiaceae bacterium]
MGIGSPGPRYRGPGRWFKFDGTAVGGDQKTRNPDVGAAGLAELVSGEDVDALVELGCEVADDSRHPEDEVCFCRSAGLGAVMAMFDLGNALRELGCTGEEGTAYRSAVAAGEDDARLNLVNVRVELGDSPGAVYAYRATKVDGRVDGAMALAFTRGVLARDCVDHRTGSVGSPRPARRAWGTGVSK